MLSRTALTSPFLPLPPFPWESSLQCMVTWTLIPVGWAVLTLPTHPSLCLSCCHFSPVPTQLFSGRGALEMKSLCTWYLRDLAYIPWGLSVRSFLSLHQTHYKEHKPKWAADAKVVMFQNLLWNYFLKAWNILLLTKQVSSKGHNYINLHCKNLPPALCH